MKEKLLAILLSITAVFMLSNCGNVLDKAEKDENSTDSKSSIDVTNYFALTDVTENTYSYFLHKSGTSSTDCKIAKTAIGDANKSSSIAYDNDIDMLCILETEELDLFMNGLGLKINVPDDTCEYVQYFPYSYWDYQPGFTTNHRKIYEGGGSCTEPEGFEYPESDDTFFVFDEVGPNDINCDEGNSYANIYVPTATSGTACNSFTFSGIDYGQTIEAGGNINNCLGGPITDTPNLSYLDNKVSLVFNMKNTTSIPPWIYKSPISQSRGNYYLANYTSQCNATGEITNWTESSGMWTVGTFAGTTFETINDARRITNGYYEWRCLDKAFDIKARIRLLVREWNRMYDLSTNNIHEYIPVEVPSLMDATGTELSGFGDWNDSRDWEDYGPSSPASCSSASTATAEIFSFPEPAN